MGKLLQKIVNGFVPSWLTRVKASTHTPPKRLLPPASTGNDHDDHCGRSGHRSSKNETLAPATASAASPAESVTPPSPPPHKETNMKDTNDRSDGIIYNASTQAHAANLHADEGIHSDKNHHLQHQHHRQYCAERPKCDHVMLESEKRSPASGGIGYVQEEQKNLLGFKRKSTYSEGGEEDDDDDDDEEKGEGHMRRSGGMRGWGWGWKRRKREEGLMSCELPKRICSIVGNAKAVVKYSQEPLQAMWESMVEMIVGNGLWELESLEFLLFCYLSLNEPHLYSIIQSSFLKVLKDLERTF